MEEEFAVKIEIKEEMPDEEPTHVWYDRIEMYLAQLIKEYKSLWLTFEEEDFGPQQMEDITQVCASINSQCNGCFTVEAVKKKWMEFRMLFEVKYYMNGSTMANRRNVYHPDGTLKDDLTESWVLFHVLSYLEDYTDGRMRKKKEAQEMEELKKRRAQKKSLV